MCYISHKSMLACHNLVDSSIMWTCPSVHSHPKKFLITHVYRRGEALGIITLTCLMHLLRSAVSSTFTGS